jgi:hypothetical protein
MGGRLKIKCTKYDRETGRCQSKNPGDRPGFLLFLFSCLVIYKYSSIEMGGAVACSKPDRSILVNGDT